MGLSSRVKKAAYEKGYEDGYEKGRQDVLDHGDWIDATESPPCELHFVQEYEVTESRSDMLWVCYYADDIPHVEFGYFQNGIWFQTNTAPFEHKIEYWMNVPVPPKKKETKQ